MAATPRPGSLRIPPASRSRSRSRSSLDFAPPGPVAVAGRAAQLVAAVPPRYSLAVRPLLLAAAGCVMGGARRPVVEFGSGSGLGLACLLG